MEVRAPPFGTPAGPSSRRSAQCIRHVPASRNHVSPVPHAQGSRIPRIWAASSRHVFALSDPAELFRPVVSEAGKASADFREPSWARTGPWWVPALGAARVPATPYIARYSPRRIPIAPGAQGCFCTSVIAPEERLSGFRVDLEAQLGDIGSHHRKRGPTADETELYARPPAHTGRRMTRRQKLARDVAPRRPFTVDQSPRPSNTAQPPRSGSR